jgi:hypothetical protein
MSVHKYSSALFAFAILAIASCGQPKVETELLPETRQGMIYLDFTEAQNVARTEGKSILLDMWRPG